MAFEKGISGNPNGRPKGSSNKTTGQLRAFITDFLEQRFEQVVEDFELLESKDRIKVYTDLLQYSLPKLQSVSAAMDLENMTDDQLDQLLQRLKNSNL